MLPADTGIAKHRDQCRRARAAVGVINDPPTHLPTSGRLAVFNFQQQGCSKMMDGSAALLPLMKE